MNERPLPGSSDPGLNGCKWVFPDEVFGVTECFGGVVGSDSALTHTRVTD
jgi:hypothetical protein